MVYVSSLSLDQLFQRILGNKKAVGMGEDETGGARQLKNCTQRRNSGGRFREVSSLVFRERTRRPLLPGNPQIPIGQDHPPKEGSTRLSVW